MTWISQIILKIKNLLDRRKISEIIRNNIRYELIQLIKNEIVQLLILETEGEEPPYGNLIIGFSINEHSFTSKINEVKNDGLEKAFDNMERKLKHKISVNKDIIEVFVYYEEDQ